MGVESRVRVDRQDVARVTRELSQIKGGLPKARSGAIRKTTDTITTRVVRAITSDLPIKRGDIFQKGNNRRPVRRRFFPAAGNITEGRVEIGATGLPQAGFVRAQGSKADRIPLSRFKARQKKRGVSYSVRKGTRATAEGSFLLKLKSGHVGVFSRRAASKLPINEMFGPSVGHVAENRPAIRGLIQRDAASLYLQNMVSQVDRLLKRKR